MSANHTGTCHICGNVGPLSFEHVPPKSAFNDQKVVRLEFQQVVGLLPDDPVPRGRIQQRGSGGYTLCERCNNKMGRWYVRPFASFCHQAMNLLIRSEGKPTLLYPYYIYPLAVIKQIVAMFFSVNGPNFQRTQPELVSFILNRDRRYLNPKYRFFLYYNLEGRTRSQGLSVKADIFSNTVISLSELTFPPFGYVMTLDSPPPSDKLIEITHLARYAYEDFEVMQLKLPVLPTHSMFPGDYRTKDEIYQQVECNRRESEALGDV